MLAQPFYITRIPNMVVKARLGGWGEHGSLPVSNTHLFSSCCYFPHILTQRRFIDGVRRCAFAACNLRGVCVRVVNQTKQKGRASEASAGN